MIITVVVMIVVVIMTFMVVVVIMTFMIIMVIMTFIHMRNPKITINSTKSQLRGKFITRVL